jgi:hypothetical protein
LGTLAEKWQSLVVLAPTRLLPLALALTLAWTARADANEDQATLAEIARLVEHRPRHAAREIELLLLAGQTDAVTDAALLALARLAAPETRATVETYARHRRTAVRLRAYEALAGLRDSTVDASLIEALRDPAPEVRALATRLLTARRARGAVDALLLALDRGVPEAALAVGHLASDAEAARLTDRLSKAPFNAMLAGCRALLCRPDIAPTTKRRVLVALEEMSGDAVHAFLRALQAKSECSLDARTNAALDEATKRTTPRPTRAPVTP